MLRLNQIFISYNNIGGRLFLISFKKEIYFENNVLIHYTSILFTQSNSIFISLIKGMLVRMISY